MLKGKTIVLGITGGIAAYKAAELTRRLVEAGAEVHVMMTKAAREFITPLTFQTLSGHPVHTDLFDLTQGEILLSPRTPHRIGNLHDRSLRLTGRNKSDPVNTRSLLKEQTIGHIELADCADLIVIAPATADILAKAAHGICDDLVTAVICATRAPVIFAPSMNVHMWENPITQENVEKLRGRGYPILEPDVGYLACGYTGKGRLPASQTIFEYLEKILTKKIQRIQ